MPFHDNFQNGSVGEDIIFPKASDLNHKLLRDLPMKKSYGRILAFCVRKMMSSATF